MNWKRLDPDDWRFAVSGRRAAVVDEGAVEHEQDGCTDEEDGGTASDTIRPREVPVEEAKPLTVLFDLSEEQHREDDETRNQAAVCE